MKPFSTLPHYVILDLETTGTTPLHDRITEIALIRFENGMETDRWETLVNPGISIPPFISHLTGITNEMVRDAPTFEDIAHKLHSCIEGAVLAAHNVRFDHGFLKSEFKRLGAVLRQKVLCTVKLSRKLYPQHRSHGLDAIMRRHGLTTHARHRAMGDVELVVAYLELAKRELGETRVLEAVASLLKGPSLPAGLDAAFLDEIPDGPGVYLFYGENDLPLYIGKSVALLKRCDGVCAGKESPALHYLRLKQALIPHRLKSWPYPGKIGIREYSEATNRSQLHVFDSWCHLGTVEDESELEDVLKTRSSLNFDLETYQLLQKSLKKNMAIIPL